jgi:hypothetical protein
MHRGGNVVEKTSLFGALETEEKCLDDSCGISRSLREAIGCAQMKNQNSLFGDDHQNG